MIGMLGLGRETFVHLHVTNSNWLTRGDHFGEQCAIFHVHGETHALFAVSEAHFGSQCECVLMPEPQTARLERNNRGEIFKKCSNERVRFKAGGHDCGGIGKGEQLAGTPG